MGLAGLEPLDEEGALLAWLERGDHADMGWMESRTEARREPARLFPGARSAICVALQYAPRPERRAGGASAAEGEGDLWPRVARYARGRDYHNVMGKRLKRLARRIREAFPGTDTRTYVDTGPVLERPLAARAGLGSVGKHTLLLDASAGSWFLLGEVFTSLELWPEGAGEAEEGAARALAPPADLCGRCTACLTACPTDALPEPYRLVADRCISYWTIEQRGAFPVEVRRGVGEWVFGCDLCQEACPYNARLTGAARGSRAAAPAPDPAFDLPPERGEVDLAALLGMEEHDFDRLFHGSPMRRAKLAGLKRNAATAMGNRGDAAYVPPLTRALADPEGMVRRHAAWALGEIAAAASTVPGAESAGDDARAALAAALAGEGAPEVREEIAAALVRAAGPEPTPADG